MPRGCPVARATAKRRLAPPLTADWRHRQTPIGATAKRRLAPPPPPIGATATADWRHRRLAPPPSVGATTPRRLAPRGADWRRLWRFPLVDSGNRHRRLPHLGLASPQHQHVALCVKGRSVTTRRSSTHNGYEGAVASTLCLLPLNSQPFDTRSILESKQTVSSQQCSQQCASG